MTESRAPSPYRIPQRCPPDRQNARNATIAARRELYSLRTDDLAGDPAEGFRLPPYLPTLPKDAQFTLQKLTDLLRHKIQGQLNGWLGTGRARKIADYDHMYRTVPPPDLVALWKSDDEFARQRVGGVNPMHLRARDTDVSGPLADVVKATLEKHGTTITKVLDAGRLFETDYALLADERVQKYVAASQRWLAAPRCIFFVGEDDVLRPAGILFPKDRSCDEDRAYGPLDDPWAWTIAKWHAQTADGALHEGFYHLFETHMVTELIAVCAARHLHVDHPIAHLLAPHTQFNLAIDCLARSDMLAPGKAIDLALSSGSAGALNAVRLEIANGWSWSARRIDRDLAARGVADAKRLPYYPYRDYGTSLHEILGKYVAQVMAPFYRSDADVAGDTELAGWLAEIASHMNGFPAKLDTVAGLFDVLTEIVFRASAGHAAVNNGQYDAYGHVPTAPGALFTPPPMSKTYTERDALAALPRGAGAIAQIGMAWTLSEPTHYGLYGVGDAPAFDAIYEPRARDAVATVRRRLVAFSEDMRSREASRPVPYTYLDPRNIERSTGT
jgi:hypothetical protein